jgi:hypothetical protein
MKITKFAALAGVALLAGVGAFAQATDDYNLPQGFKFSNEIGSDVVKVTGNAHKDYTDSNWRSEFAGIYDKIVVGYDSEKLSFSLEPKFGIRDVNENYYDGDGTASGFYQKFYGHGDGFGREKVAGKAANNADAHGTLNSDDLAWNFWGVDWDFRFSPFDIVDFYLNAGPHIVGSKLFARDTEWGANYLGSDGFAIVTKPIDGLRISGAIPFGYSVVSNPNYMDAEVEDYWIPGDAGKTRARADIQGANRFRLDIGADYTLSSGLVGAGAKVEDIINAGYRKYGIYAGLNLGALSANLGYNFTEDYTDFLDAFDNGLIKIRGKQAIAGSVAFVAGDLKLMADAMYNLKNKQSVYDMYAGAKVAYDLVPGKFNVDMLLGIAMDLGTNAHHGTAEDDLDLKAAMGSINGNFIDLYYGHAALEDIRAAVGTAIADDGTKVPGVWNNGVAANQNWQYYTALARQMSNGNLDTTSAAKAALALRLKPGFTYNTGKNEFGAHVDVTNFFDGDGSYQIKFPVYWKWTF